MRNTGHYLLQLRGGDREQWPKDEDGQLLEPVKDGTMVDIKGDLLILAVGNGRQAGGGVPLCPDAGVCVSVLWYMFGVLNRFKGVGFSVAWPQVCVPLCPDAGVMSAQVAC